MVTLDATGELLTIDRNSLSIRDRVATGDTPHAVVVAEGVSYVTQSGDNRLWTWRGGLASSTGTQPESVAIVGDRVVTADRGGSLSVFTRAPFAFVVRLTLEGGPVRVVAIDDVRVAVSLGDDERVAIVDIERAELVETLDVGSHPDGLCLSPDGVFLAAVSSGAGHVKIYRVSDWAAGAYAPCNDARAGHLRLAVAGAVDRRRRSRYGFRMSEGQCQLGGRFRRCPNRASGTCQYCGALVLRRAQAISPKASRLFARASPVRPSRTMSRPIGSTSKMPSVSTVRASAASRAATSAGRSSAPSALASTAPPTSRTRCTLPPAGSRPHAGRAFARTAGIAARSGAGDDLPRPQTGRPNRLVTGPSPPLPGVSVSDIEVAREAIADRVRLTPVWPSLTLEGIAGVPILQKCEQMQRTGSFKIRGALNVVRGLSATGRKRGLVTASAGNHAQGVALAAREAGIEATVVMPVLAPLSKATATQSHGARVVRFGASLEDAREHAQVLAERDGGLYVPPFDDDAVIAGQGTLGLELLEQVPDLAEVIVPAGGGGLLAGVATAVKARRPEVRVIGVQAAAMDGLCRSFAAGEVRTVPPARTLADGAAVAGPSERTFALIQAHVDEMVSCGDTAIAQAIVLLLERSKMVVEGAGALGVAALISGVYRPKGKAAVVLSGGNIDVNLVGSIVRHGLVEGWALPSPHGGGGGYVGGARAGLGRDRGRSREPSAGAPRSRGSWATGRGRRHRPSYRGQRSGPFRPRDELAAG